MRKIFTFLFAIVLSINVFAQCPLTTAVDFNATDCHGTEVHLFDILDGGQYVLVDFFFASCNPCQQATPKVVESYYAFGCNMHDVFYVEISDRDSDAVCQNWVNNYGVEYPTIGGPAGGATICNQYQIGAFPTVILIAPDRHIVINDLWPINNAQTVINQLQNYGIQQYDCQSDNIPDFTTNDVKGNEIHLYDILDGGQYVLLNFFQSDYQPCQAVTSAMVETYSMFGCNEEQVYYMEISPSDYDLECIRWMYNNNVKYPTISRDGNGNAIAQSIPVALYPTLMLIRPNHTIANHDIYPVVDAQTIIDALQNEGIQQHDCQQPVVFNTDVVYIEDIEDYPSSGYFVMTNNSENVVEIVGYESEEFEIDCEEESLGFGDITGKTLEPDESMTVAVTVLEFHKGLDTYIGKLNLMTSQGNYILIVLLDVYYGLDEFGTNSFTLYPNPVKENLMISGNNLGNISIFNTLGQKIKEIEVNNDEMSIDVSGFENGVYFVKVGDKTQKFVVTH